MKRKKVRETSDTEKASEAQRLVATIEQEFGKYGFEPFKLEEISMGDIEKSVLQVVANYLFAMARYVVRFAEKGVERTMKEDNRNVGEGIEAVVSQRFTDQCRIKSRGLVIGVEYKYQQICGMGGLHDDSENARITIIGRGKTETEEVFSAECLWEDSVDRESVKISTDTNAKKAFQLLQEKYRKT